MDTLKELIEASRVSRKAAASVYHRDYERTKDKPYRKYDPRNHKKSTEEEEVSDEVDSEEAVEEGAWDFIKGAAGHVGGKVQQAVGNAVQAGQQASVIGDIAKKIGQLAQALAVYDKLKGSQQPTQPQQPQQRPNPARQRVSAPAQGKPSDAVPAAFRATQKPRIRNGEFVFSAYLQDTDGDFLSEGVWDFIKGAGGYAGGQVKQAVGNTVQAGRDASNAADFKQAQSQAKQLIAELKALLQKTGNAKQVLAQVFGKSTLNPMIQQRIMKLIAGQQQRQAQ